MSSEMNRREALTLMALAPFAAVPGVGSTAPETLPVQLRPDASEPQREQGERFFTPHEFATVSVLADLIIPADERSGSATDAGVPEFIDFMMRDAWDDGPRLAMRGGLAWLDAESRRRFEKVFVEGSPAQQREILDDIAWPERAAPELSHGVAFFNRFRDLVASGFWSSRMGVEDIQYQGNTAVAEWTGCPPEALRRLGVSYDS